MTVSPPSAPAVNATATELLARVTPVIVGAEGAVPATKAPVAVDGSLSPIAFETMTEQV